MVFVDIVFAVVFVGLCRDFFCGNDVRQCYHVVVGLFGFFGRVCDMIDVFVVDFFRGPCVFPDLTDKRRTVGFAVIVGKIERRAVLWGILFVCFVVTVNVGV